MTQMKNQSQTGANDIFDAAVVGLGYVGLTLAMAGAQAGLRILGFDIDHSKVAGLKAGDSYIDDVTHAEVASALAGGFTPTVDSEKLSGADTIVICVPTPLTDHQPDLSSIRSAGEMVGHQLQPGRLVILESTTYPGTTEEVLQPILEDASGLEAGTDFQLAYSPERIDPGNSNWTIRNTPKIVGGIDEASTERAFAFYRNFCDHVVGAPGTREAELAKLVENTYRHVNIALANELAIFARELGIDIWDVIRLAATKPFGFEAFYPGPGVGGHCIPIDPNYLSHRVRKLGRQFRFVELAEEINAQMPAYVVQRTVGILNRESKAVRGSQVLLIGVAYKADVSDVRESPATGIASRLRAMGAELSYWDPHVSSFTVDGEEIRRVEDAVQAAPEADIVLILTSHSALDVDAVVAAASAVFDTRGVTKPGAAERL